ncbi:MAG: hypothetical protein U1E35_02665 [Rhodospirillales bacterium]
MAEERASAEARIAAPEASAARSGDDENELAPPCTRLAELT